MRLALGFQAFGLRGGTWDSAVPDFLACAGGFRGSAP